ncbi:aldolase [Sciscionella sediminilitoris]|uniref:RraA family protein n=1 Tax=Sciscionella sediminilitoris TaxID=1445613 RepID=UPI0004DF2E63|nr:aldolase [Sciscionella sp. SE31]
MFIDAPADSCRVAPAWPRPDAETLAAFAAFPTANIGDAQDRLGLVNGTVRAQWPGARCTGAALPVLTREGDNLAIHRALDEAVPGDVLVVNALGENSRAVFGDLLAEICRTRGVRGVVLDGATRDATAIAELGLPLWARASSPAGPTKNGPGVIGEPVAIGGVVVSPGDIVVADADGVAVVSPQRAAELLDRLETIEHYETGLRQRIRAEGAAA